MGIEQAIEMCREALKLNPNYASAHCLLADCLSYKGVSSEALIEYERTLNLDNTRRRFLTRYGVALSSMTSNEYQAALEQLKQKEPELFQQHIYFDTPWEEAIDKFDRVQKMSSIFSDTPEEQQEDRAYYHYQRGYAYLQAGLLNKAVEDFAVGRKLAPENMQLVQAYSYALSLRRKQESKKFSNR
jgi:tetratricopeptide (TPR) repeat protein